MPSDLPDVALAVIMLAVIGYAATILLRRMFGEDARK